MLTMKIGHDVDYLTDAVAKGREGYYTGAVAAGEPPGLWYGAGAAELGLSGEVDAEVMKALYTHGLDPRDPATASRETWAKAARIGNPPRNYRKADEIYAALLEAHPDAGPEERAQLRAQAARSARQSVTFYDVVLSAPKSMTMLWVACERAASDAAAAGDHDAAAQWKRAAGVVEEGLLVGHRAVLDFYADQAGYARAGHHGGGAGQWVDAHQLIAAQFLQHDSRDHDPQLHVHGPVANKALCADGKWRAIDATLITQWKPAAAAIGERTAEAYVWQQLGVSWQTRPDGMAREIVGVDTESMGVFSKRTAAITPKLEELMSRFRDEVGRAPTASERSKLGEHAFLATRQGKVFGGETREGQIARWAGEHAARLGVELGEVARTVLDHPAGAPALWSERDVVARALAAVEQAKQSWTRADLQMAICQALPGHLGVGPEHVRPLLEGLTDKAEALARHLNPGSGPQGLDARYYRADGESVFVKPGSARYATDTQLLGEEELRAAAVRRGAPTFTDAQVDELLARFTRAGRELGADQAAALRGILTSGAAVEVLTAPAGTGKSFLVGALADTWPQHHPGQPTGSNGTAGEPGTPGPASPGGQPGPAPTPMAGEGRRVFGVAFGQRQADVLAEEGVTARNIRRWLDGQARLDRGVGSAQDEAFRLRAGDLLVVDEAGAAPTADLVAIHRRCAQAGVKLLLVGDPRQLGAVGAGGALADIAERGIRYELAEVRRFREGWEGPASLRLRDGDTTVVDEYAKRGRLVDAGTAEQAEAAASRVWLAETLAGREALLMVASNAAAARVSTALRNELVRLGRVQELGVPLGMQGTVAGVGDLVQARRNAWHLEGWAGNTEAPINRQTYRVTGLHPGGGLTVARVVGRDTDGAEQLGAPLRLPAGYVNSQVTLAYASTVHAALGRTVDAGYPVLGPGTDPAAGYVQLSRGREANIAFVITRNVADDADTGETHKITRRSPAEVLADVIRPREHDPNRGALREAEDAAEHAAATTTHIDPLIAVIGDSLAGRTARWLDRLAADSLLPERHRVALAADEARDSLDQLLRSAELAGHDPAQVLVDGVRSSSLDGSASVAQVLHFRIRTALDGKLDPQVGGYADLIPRGLPEHDRGGLEQLAAAADARRVELGAQLAAAPSQWAREALGPVPDAADDPAGRAEWERRAGWAASYRELVDHADDADPLGPAPPAGLAEQHAVFRTAHTALDLAAAGADEEAMSEGQLRARVAAWEREQAWAPRYVADELEAAHAELRRARTDATVWAARADALAQTGADPLAADQLRAAAEQAQQRAEQLAPILADLQLADDARAAWLRETAITRDNAERARYGAGLRGIDLDAPAERVTAQDWVDAHHIAQLAADADRDITEHDLSTDELFDDNQAREALDDSPGSEVPDDDVVDHEHSDRPRDDNDRADEPREDDRGDDPCADDRVGGDDPPDRHVDEVLVEPAPPDIRDTAVPDAGERVDPAERRRVPLPDQTAATVDRAKLVLAEIETRRAAEAAEAAEQARAGAVEPDEDDRRDELARWADQDTPDAGVRPDRSDQCADELDLARDDN
jgi:conjugative relaxase-like TrwC/TraI family protein